MSTKPSFSSLPPSFSSFPDLDAGPSKSSSSTKPDKEEKKKRKREEKLKEERRSSSERHRKHGTYKASAKKERRSERDERDEVPAILSKKSADGLSEYPNILFYTDRKGDPMNLQYGGLHAGDVPKHRLVAGGRNILGLPRALVVLRRHRRGIEVGLSHYRKASSLTDSSSRVLLLQPPSRQVIPLSDPSKYQEEDGFIRLPSRGSQAVVNDGSYRSIAVGEDNGHSDSSVASDSDESSSSDDESERPVLSAHQQTLKCLDQELTRNPTAIDTWLSLLQQTLSTIPITSKNATKARCEITVSILARALAATPQNTSSKELRIPFLKAGEEIWHESKLRLEWEEALKVGGIELHMEWLEWKIRNGNTGVIGIVESALRALSSLGNDEQAQIGKVRIFWRVANALRTAGYCERAMAMFQAQAEILFNSPLSITKMAFQTQLNELEEFWESEVPRLGEDGAEGWASWYSSKVPRQPIPSHRVDTPIIPDLDPYRQWANQEMKSDRCVSLPLRSDAETEDPFSTVLFSDIRSMMLNVTSQPAKHAFRIAWLSFLGLHTPGLVLATSQSLDWDDRWNLHHLMIAPFLNSIFPPDLTQRKLLTDTVAGVAIGREREYITPFGPVRCWGSSVSGPLDLSSSDPSRPLRKGMWSAEDVQDVDERVVRHLFSALRLDDDDADWDILALAFEAAISPKNATKVSKSFLAVHQDSIPLWNAHAQLERMRGRLNDARKIYQTVLIGNSSKHIQRLGSLMWWNWAEMEWLAGDDQAAQNVVLKSVGLDGAHSGVTILRAKRSLDDNATQPSFGWKEQEAWIKLRALLELLSGHGPRQMLSVFDDYLPLASGSAAKESWTTASLMMLYCYGTTLKRPMPPSLLRERAHGAFEDYPSNSILLGILLEAERGQGIWGRIRTLLGANDGKAKDVARRVEEVWIAGWERGRWTSEIERTRNGLAAAIEHERTRASPVIWRIYIEFEIRARELQRAKKLLFRAIGECPLVKELYLLAFGPLRSVFQVHELNGLADTMVERGIRLRQSLDEIVEGMDVVEERGERSDDSGDEIEHNARELRRLMP